MSAEELRVLYDRFLQKTMRMLENNGIVVLYTTMPDIFKSQLKKYDEYTLEKEAVINERENSRLLILRFRV